MERETGFEPATACLEGRPPDLPVSTLIADTNLLDMTPRLTGRQVVGFQCAPALACPIIPYLPGGHPQAVGRDLRRASSESTAGE